MNIHQLSCELKAGYRAKVYVYEQRDKKFVLKDFLTKVAFTLRPIVVVTSGSNGLR